MLTLADLKGMDRDGLVAHISREYESDVDDDVEFLIAYESVGDFGCDSTSYFLLKIDGELCEVEGGHNSCNGFEGQWFPVRTVLAAIKARPHVFWCGMYDYSGSENEAAAKAFVEAMS